VNYALTTRLEDRLGPSEPPYRSRGEAQIGRLLNRYGIPFTYEQPTLVYDRGRHRLWRPDFTLPTYDNLIVEYAGMMDIPGYAAGIRHKRRAYTANGLRAVFVYPHHLTGPVWPQRLADRIGRYAARRPMQISHEFRDHARPPCQAYR
jgi:hypothetical protein